MRPVTLSLDSDPGCSRPMIMSWRDDPRPIWAVHLEYLRVPAGGESADRAGWPDRLRASLAATGLTAAPAVACDPELLRIDLLIKEEDEQLAMEAARLVAAVADRAAGPLLAELIFWDVAPHDQPGPPQVVEDAELRDEGEAMTACAGPSFTSGRLACAGERASGETPS